MNKNEDKDRTHYEKLEEIFSELLETTMWKHLSEKSIEKKAQEKCRIIQEVMQIKKENKSEDQKLTT